MTDLYNMKTVFSCSDFLSDLWQGSHDDTEALNALASEGGSTQLGHGKSSDLLNMLEPTQEADSNSCGMNSLAASSSDKQETSGNRTFGLRLLLRCSNTTAESEAELRDGLPFIVRRAM